MRFVDRLMQMARFHTGLAFLHMAAAHNMDKVSGRAQEVTALS